MLIEIGYKNGHSTSFARARARVHAEECNSIYVT